MSDDSFAKVDGSVDDGLLLLPLQDPGDDGLGGDAEPSVVDHHRAKGVKTLQVDRVVDFHTLQDK